MQRLFITDFTHCPKNLISSDYVEGLRRALTPTYSFRNSGWIGHNRVGMECTLWPFHSERERRISCVGHRDPSLRLRMTVEAEDILPFVDGQTPRSFAAAQDDSRWSNRFSSLDKLIKQFVVDNESSIRGFFNHPKYVYICRSSPDKLTNKLSLKMSGI